MRKRECLNPRDPSLGRIGSETWNAAVFERAYCGETGPFQRVRERLRLGFSVLVYLPGNCMRAAAEHVKQFVTGPWVEYGLSSTGKTSILEIFKETSGLFEPLLRWSRGDDAQPNAIFHNLDLLSDGRGSVYPHPDAHTALFSLIEGTRSGVVLGLADRDAGRLPDPIARAFPEHFTIDAVDHQSFAQLVPQPLWDKLARDGALPEATAWLLASRLRWIDPIRAVRIMVAAAAEANDLDAILERIWRSTRVIDFSDPVVGGEDHIAGFPHEIIEYLETAVVRPFRRWTTFRGVDRKACEAELRKLPKGLILHGPPGTGKTTLARWLASSVALPVRVLSGAEIKASLFGEAEKNVHRVFDQARRAAPCVIVLDDADDLLPDRASARGATASAERGIVEAFLQEIEGWRGSLAGVLIILTTNRIDDVDAAARSKLRRRLRVPFPLDKSQIGELVDRIAETYRFTLESKVREVLVEHFFGTVSRQASPGSPIDSREQRHGIETNLFSPREMQQAMLLLEDSPNPHSENYAPTLEDVKRMKRLYDELVG